MQAVDVVLNKCKSLFLTGQAASDKTHFLKYLSEQCKRNELHVAIVTPRVIAAINTDGQTMHSFFQIPISVFSPEGKRIRTKNSYGDSNKILIYNIICLS